MRVLLRKLKFFFVLASDFRIQFNSEEQWTKALKYTLVNMKWALAIVNAQMIEEEAQSGDV
jgi:hypothetical protein